ncbi:hypothetical protein [Actinocrispum wychmicini]|uniref:hypothetical protein n=1 Tax=Actinocrispum wychmicini TaxID=1213861 RepID=UPI003C7DFCA0
MRTRRIEVCDRVLILNAAHARHVLAENQRYYIQHRPHQAWQQRPPEPCRQPKLYRRPTLAPCYAPMSSVDSSTSPIRSLTCNDDFSSGIGQMFVHGRIVMSVPDTSSPMTLVHRRTPSPSAGLAPSVGSAPTGSSSSESATYASCSASASPITTPGAATKATGCFYMPSTTNQT